MGPSNLAAELPEAHDLEFPPPRPSGCPFDAPEELMRLRSDEPAARVRLWDGQEAWLFTRYEDVHAVLGDVRFGADALDSRYPHESPSIKETRAHQRTLLTMDPPEHTALRRILARNFVIRRLEQMRPNIQRIVDELIDDVAALEPPADLVSHVVVPLPALAVSSFLGVPAEDRHLFFELVSKQTDVSTTTEEGRANYEAFFDYIDNVLTLKETDPGEDVISRLLAEHTENGTMSRIDVVANIRVLLSAAFESTANQLGLGVLLLLLHPEQRARLAEPGMVDSAVEEILRYATIDQFGRRRLATEDVEIGGVLVRAGDAVVVSQTSANRDPEIFADADRFDITRGDARRHVAFSHGVHQCLGQALARLEMQIGLQTIFQRIPTLRLAAPLGEIPFKTEKALYGLHSLPVTWDPGTILPAVGV